MTVVEVSYLFWREVRQLNLCTNVEGRLIQVANELVGFCRSD